MFQTHTRVHHVHKQTHDMLYTCNDVCPVHVHVCTCTYYITPTCQHVSVIVDVHSTSTWYM